MLKTWDAAEKFVQRVFFSEFSNLKTGSEKVRTQLKGVLDVFGQVYTSLMPSNNLKVREEYYRRLDNIQGSKDYSTVRLSSLVQYLTKYGLIKKIAEVTEVW